jgi:hypothetical protein
LSCNFPIKGGVSLKIGDGDRAKSRFIGFVIRELENKWNRGSSKVIQRWFISNAPARCLSVLLPYFN